ncbi:MAG: nucleotidyltransferase family protein [Bacteroidales bacterium]|nr:nucleotidyltransferase family protein [Bacteroidales bacterium]
MTDLFLALVRSGLHERPLAAEELQQARAATAADWASILTAARQQTVLGQLYQALFLLPPDVKPPEKVVTAIMSEALRSVRRSYAVTAATEKLVERLRSAGLSPVVMKGVTVAAFYRRPEFRAAGDIDLYLPKDQFSKALQYLDNPQAATDGGIHSKEDGIDIDLHDNYYDLHCRQSLLPEPGTPEATLLMLSAHILKHAIGPGVGLRQLCDMTMAVQTLGSKCDPSALRTLFRRTGTLRWNRLLFSFLSEHLSMSDPVFSDKEHISSESLMRIVMDGGNFGHYAAARQTALDAGDKRRKLNTLSQILKRMPFSLRYSPRETFARIGTLIRGNLHW